MQSRWQTDECAKDRRRRRRRTPVASRRAATTVTANITNFAGYVSTCAIEDERGRAWGCCSRKWCDTTLWCAYRHRRTGIQRALGLGTYAPEPGRCPGRARDLHAFVIIRRPDSGHPSPCDRTSEEVVIDGDPPHTEFLAAPSPTAPTRSVSHSLHHFLPFRTARATRRPHAARSHLAGTSVAHSLGRVAPVAACRLISTLAWRCPTPMRHADHVIAISAYTRSRKLSFTSAYPRTRSLSCTTASNIAFSPRRPHSRRVTLFPLPRNSRPYRTCRLPFAHLPRSRTSRPRFASSSLVAAIRQSN